MSREDNNWLEGNFHAGGFPNSYEHTSHSHSPASDQPPPDRVASPYYAQQPSQTQYGASSQTQNPGSLFQYPESAHQPVYRYQEHYYHSPYYHSIYEPPPPQLGAPSALPPPQSQTRSQLPASKQTPSPALSSNHISSDRNWYFPASSSKTSTTPPAPQAAVTHRPQNNTSNRDVNFPSPSSKSSTIPPAPKIAGTNQPQKKPWSVYSPSSNTPPMPPAHVPTPATTKEPQKNLTTDHKWRTYTPNTSTMQPTSQRMTVQPPPAKKQRVQGPSSTSTSPSVRLPIVQPPNVHSSGVQAPSAQTSSVHPPSVRPPSTQSPNVQPPGVRPPSAYPPRGYFNTHSTSVPPAGALRAGPHPASAFPPASSTPQNKLSEFYPSEDKYLKHSPDIAKSLDEASAAVKTTYNPETIARDVLIASGRHPTEKPLNYHLFRLRDVFTHVEFNTDLATFRWDLVDPGAPVPIHRVAKPRDTPKAPRPAAPINTIVEPAPAPQPASVPPPPPQLSPLKTLPKKTPPQNTPKPSPCSQPVVEVRLPSTPTSIATPKMINGSGIGRKPGRPPKSSKLPVVQVQVGPAPEYPVYKCEWDSCQAELHNLETLKKHTYKVHVPFSLTCQWKGCTTMQPMPAVELLKHMKKDHIELVAWKQGDGPSVLGSVDDDDANMSSSILTIPDLNQPISEDPLIFPASGGSIRAFNQVHGHRTQRDKALQILKAVQRLKEQVGFGLDPGGCQLATPVRNERFSNEEDVYEVKSV